MKYLSSIFAGTRFLIILACSYTTLITVISTVKMNYYHNKRMELWPNPKAFEYSAKWFATANWRDKMLPYLPSLGFKNHDKSFGAYPRPGKVIEENWEGTVININAVKPFPEEIKPDSVYLEPVDLYHWIHPKFTPIISWNSNIYYGVPQSEIPVKVTTSPVGLSSLNVTYDVFPYYTGSLTAPLNVGSYSITVPPRMPCIDCMVAEMHLKVVILFAVMIALCYIGIFIHDLYLWIKKRKEPILPDDDIPFNPPFQNF